MRLFSTWRQDPDAFIEEQWREQRAAERATRVPERDRLAVKHQAIAAAGVGELAGLENAADTARAEHAKVTERAFTDWRRAEQAVVDFRLALRSKPDPIERELAADPRSASTTSSRRWTRSLALSKLASFASRSTAAANRPPPRRQLRLRRTRAAASGPCCKRGTQRARRSCT